MAAPRTRTTTAPIAPTEAELGSAAQRERRKRILDATLALASKGGYEAVQMRTVARAGRRRAGHAVPVLPVQDPSAGVRPGQGVRAHPGTARPHAAPGDTPYDRMIYVLGRMTRSMQREPLLTEAMTRAFMFADPSAAAEVNTVARMMEEMLTKAMHDGEPTADDAAIARVIGDVWLSNLVAWVTRRASANDVSNHLELAARLLLR